MNIKAIIMASRESLPIVIKFCDREYYIRATSKNHLHMSLYNPELIKKPEIDKKIEKNT